MKTTCEVCDRKFSASEALCDDWKDPERSFGCPECGTFYVKNMKPDSKAGLLAGGLGGGAGTASMMLLSHGIRQSDEKVIMLSTVIIVFGLIGAAIAISLSKQPLVRSPYRGGSTTRAGQAFGVSKVAS